nr:uncharacterized protein LOC117691026 [Crassostrea gigas]
MKLSLLLCCILYNYQTLVWSAPSSNRCLSTEQNPHGCCDGYKWDSAVDNCVECSPGYSGPGCFITCPYPLYGENCQNICNCSSTEYCDFMFGCLEKQEEISTISIVFASSFDRTVFSTHHLGGSSSLTIPKIIEANIGENLQNRLQTIWQFILIILAVLSLLAFTYVGKCLYRQWTSRSLQVSNSNTTAPESALNMRNEIECFYEQIQNIEYEEPERYLTAAQDDSHRDGINSSQEKMDDVSFKSIGPSIAPSNDEPLINENVFYENQSKNGVRETDGLYLSPIV